MYSKYSSSITIIFITFDIPNNDVANWLYKFIDTYVRLTHALRLYRIFQMGKNHKKMKLHIYITIVIILKCWLILTFYSRFPTKNLFKHYTYCIIYKKNVTRAFDRRQPRIMTSKYWSASVRCQSRLFRDRGLESDHACARYPKL